MSCTLDVRSFVQALWSKRDLETRVISSASFQKQELSYCLCANVYSFGAGSVKNRRFALLSNCGTVGPKVSQGS